MDQSTRQEIIAGMKETSRIIEQTRKLEAAAPGHRLQRGRTEEPASQAMERASLFMDPARFWTWRAQSELGLATNEDKLEEVASLAVRLLAADMATGNMARAREALVGQSVWLSALAAKLSAKAAQVPEEYGSDERQSKLWKLAMQAQRQAAQTLCSAVALGQEGVSV